MELKEQNNKFISPTFGEMGFENIVSKIVGYVEGDSDYQYRLIIGTDSQDKNSHGADFVTAIILHKVGAGGIYFWQRETNPNHLALKARIIEEAVRSLLCAQKFLDALGRENGIMKTLEIHVDVGQKGPTREIIGEVVGMVRGSGFEVKIKPDAFGASKVADRHT